MSYLDLKEKVLTMDCETSAEDEWVGASSPLRAKHHLQAGSDFLGFKQIRIFLVFEQIRIFLFFTQIFLVRMEMTKTQMMMYIAFFLHVYVPQKVARYKINEEFGSYTYICRSSFIHLTWP